MAMLYVMAYPAVTENATTSPTEGIFVVAFGCLHFDNYGAFEI
jgi:hypothetical protein